MLLASYSDSWCIQGGRVSGNDSTITITFMKPFRNANYNVTQAEIGHSGADPYVNGYTFHTFTNTSMICCMRNNGYNTCMWEASGLI